MDLKEIMNQKNFVVVGDTTNSEKYAAKIKNGLAEKGYTAYGVGKELASINDVPGDIDIIDLCIRADKGLELVKENKKMFKCVVIQPGAESPELLDWLSKNSVPYIQGCLLVGMSLYSRK
ncbi:MAG: CoA-binding protein [Oscillospiraceae bacterium]|nr:CoA-binding protein [Oscillospiraceae bacterium]